MASEPSKKDPLTTLAVRMKKGDRKAAAALYDELSPKVYGFFFTRTGRRETAEDLSQDMFLKLVEKVDSFDETRGRFVVWFWQVARNLLVDYYREKKEVAFSAFEESQVEAMSITEAPDLDGRLGYRKVQHLVKSLSEEEKELFELRFVAEMPYREVSEIMGKSEIALRVAASRIKGRIKKELKDEI